MGALLLTATVAVLCVFLRRTAEPVYQGKPLSEWVLENRLSYGMSENQEAAIRAIGTNSLPFLIKWMQSQWHPWTPKLLPAFARKFLSRRMNLAHGSSVAFRVLR